MTETIKSLKDERIQLARSLKSATIRKELGKFLIKSVEAINWANEAGVKLDFILSADSDIVPRFPGSPPAYILSEGLMKKVTGTKYLIPAIAIANIKKIDCEDDFLIVLDNLQDFGNIGTIIRTAHAFGIKTIYNTRKDSDLYQQKIIDASRGKVFNTNHKVFNDSCDAIKYLRERGYRIVTTSPHGKRLQSFIELDERPLALVIGNETDGASEQFIKEADFLVQIPMAGEVESLNAGVAAGISIYELKLKRVLGMIEKKIKSTLGRELNVAAMLIRDALDTELSKVSVLSSSQLIFMMVLKCDVVMDKTAIQKQFGIPDSEIDVFLEPLISEGFLERKEESYLITLAGVETIGKLWTIIENTEKKILADFAEDEKKELKRMLGKIQVNCAGIIGEDGSRNN